MDRRFRNPRSQLLTFASKIAPGFFLWLAEPFTMNEFEAGSGSV
jgi:hypothetical protein